MTTEQTLLLEGVTELFSTMGETVTFGGSSATAVVNRSAGGGSNLSFGIATDEREGSEVWLSGSLSEPTEGEIITAGTEKHQIEEVHSSGLSAYWRCICRMTR